MASMLSSLSRCPSTQLRPESPSVPSFRSRKRPNSSVRAFVQEPQTAEQLVEQEVPQIVSQDVAQTVEQTRVFPVPARGCSQSG